MLNKRGRGGATKRTGLLGLLAVGDVLRRDEDTPLLHKPDPKQNDVHECKSVDASETDESATVGEGTEKWRGRERSGKERRKARALFFVVFLEVDGLDLRGWGNVGHGHGLSKDV